MYLKKIITSFIFCLTFLSLVFLLSSSASAQDQLDQHEHNFSKRNQIIIGSELDYAPYALVNENGEADGFSVDLIKAVCNAMDIQYTFRIGPWNEVRGALEKAEVDALPLVGYTKERDILFDFTKPHTPSYGIIFKRKNAAGIDSLDELKGKTVIAMKSDNTHDYLIKNHITDKIVTVTTMDEVFEKLASGDYDYAIGPRLVGLLLMNQHDIKGIELTGPLIEAYGPGYGFAVHTGDAILLSLLNQGLSIVKADGTYDEIYEKWFGIIDPKSGMSEEFFRKVMFGVSGLVAIIFITLVWSFSLRRKVAIKTSELRESKLLYKDLYDNSPDMYASVDAKTRCVKQCNQRLADELGYKLEEILGKPIFEFYHPDCMEKVKKAFHEFITVGSVHDAELQLKRKDGSKVEVSLNVSAVRDEKGEILHSRSVWRDNTERKEMLEKLKELNTNLEKLVAEEVEKSRQKDHILLKQSRHLDMAQLLVNIAHQWRQPICAIGALAQDIEDAYQCNELNKAYLHDSVETIMVEVEELSKTIRQFSTFFAEEPEVVEFNIESEVQKSLTMLENKLERQDVAVEVSVQGEFQGVGYPNEFKQAVYNIINNTIDACEERTIQNGKMNIVIKKNVDNGKTRIEIADNAGGIDDDVLEKVFDPYYTTNVKARGKGVGLFMSKTIIETNMHGSIFVEKISDGAKFIIEV